MRFYKLEKSEGRAFRYFNIMYALALSTVALITILSQVLTQRYLDNQLDDSHVINMAGQQRTLSQKVVKYCMIIGEGTINENTIKDLEVSFNKMKATYKGLQQGNKKMDLPGENSEVVQIMFNDIDPIYQRVTTSIENILTEVKKEKPNNNIVEGNVAELMKYEEKFLEGMDLIVFQYDNEAKEKVRKLKSVELVLMAIVLLTLVLVIVFIFNPTANNIKTLISELIQSESNAMKMASELNELNISLEKSNKDIRDISFALDEATLFVKTDRVGNITYANEKYCKLTRYSYEELIGKKLFFNNIGDEESIVYEHINNDEDRHKVWRGEVYDHAKDLTGFYLDVTLIPIFSKEGELYQYVVICSDITKRKETEKELQRITEDKFNQQVSEHRIRSQSIIYGQEQERKRMAREVHDGVGQMLTALKFNVEAVSPATEPQGKQLSNIKKLLQSVIKEIRRISSDLVPSVLNDFGLGAAINELVSVSKSSGIAITYDNSLNLTKRLDKTIEVSLYRIAQEAINNALKYSRATNIKINLNNDVEFLNLSIIDDGVGFIPDEALQFHRGKSTGNGLTSMNERAELIDGKLLINSAPGKGTIIFVEVPLDRESYEQD